MLKIKKPANTSGWDMQVQCRRGLSSSYRLGGSEGGTLGNKLPWYRQELDEKRCKEWCTAPHRAIRALHQRAEQ